ncbi:MAG: hypothetical protein ABH830_03225 [Patescibacteria group bacterium]
MITKAVDFVIMVAINGFISIFIAILMYIVLAVVFAFAMIPVNIIAGDKITAGIMNFANKDFGFRIIYAIVFVSLIMDDLGVPNIKTAFKKWREKRKQK